MSNALFLSVSPSRAVVCWLAAGIIVAVVAGCGRSDGVMRFPVQGRVTLDGQLVNDVSVVFEPRQPGGVVAVAPVVNGDFKCSRENGPTAGDFDVRFNPDGLEEAEVLGMARQLQQQQRRQRRPSIDKISLPRHYQRPGSLRATVTAGGPNYFEFSLVSK